MGGAVHTDGGWPTFAFFAKVGACALCSARSLPLERCSPLIDAHGPSLPAVPPADLLQHLQKPIAALGSSQPWLPMITTAVDEMKLPSPAIALGMIRHPRTLALRPLEGCDE